MKELNNYVIVRMEAYDGTAVNLRVRGEQAEELNRVIHELGAAYCAKQLEPVMKDLQKALDDLCNCMHNRGNF